MDRLRRICHGRKARADSQDSQYNYEYKNADRSINGQIQQIERARIWLIALFLSAALDGLGCRFGNCLLELAGREHAHEEVGEMEKHGTHDLFGSVERPYLDRSLRPFAPALVDEREESKATERGLHENCERTEELTFACVLGAIWWGDCGDHCG